MMSFSNIGEAGVLKTTLNSPDQFHATDMFPEYIRAFLAAPVSTFEKIAPLLPPDASCFETQLFPKGFDIAIHHSLANTRYSFEAGMSAAQQSLAQRLLDLLDPAPLLFSPIRPDGLLLCARWCPSFPNSIFAVRLYLTIDETQQLVHMAVGVPSLSIGSAESRETQDVAEVYQLATGAFVSAWSKIQSRASKPWLKIEGVLFSPTEHGSDVPSFVVPMRGGF